MIVLREVGVGDCLQYYHVIQVVWNIIIYLPVLYSLNVGDIYFNFAIYNIIRVRDTITWYNVPTYYKIHLWRPLVVIYMEVIYKSFIVPG